jgi:hypothetical protein
MNDFFFLSNVLLQVSPCFLVFGKHIVIFMISSSSFPSSLGGKEKRPSFQVICVYVYVYMSQYIYTYLYMSHTTTTPYSLSLSLSLSVCVCVW